jgi:hypothetical protein
MNLYKAICKTVGCPAIYSVFELWADEVPVNVVCGNCGELITDIEPEEIA